MGCIYSVCYLHKELVLQLIHESAVLPDVRLERLTGRNDILESHTLHVAGPDCKVLLALTPVHRWHIPALRYSSFTPYFVSGLCRL